MANVRVQQGVHIAAVFAGGILEMEQPPNLGVRHVQHAATADEGQPFDMRFGVDAKVAVAACWRGE
ncbi:hypothetical protein D3C84_1045510 [compost metagenome]